MYRELNKYNNSYLKLILYGEFMFNIEYKVKKNVRVMNLQDFIKYRINVLD